MANTGGAACTLTVRVGNRAGGPWTYTVAPGAKVEDWFSVGRTSGWYDLTASGPDGFVRRFAGHSETGSESTSDPVMGSGVLAGTSQVSSGEVRVDLGVARTVTAVRCEPRQAGPYEVHLSADGTSWGSPVASGTLTDPATVRLWPETARYVRVRAALTTVTALGW
jgi:phospholipase C